MITVKLYGKLGKRFGREWTLHAKSIAEALHAIDVLKGGFFDYIMEMEKDVQGYHVQVDERTIGEDMLPFQFAGSTVTITPLLRGTDTKGILTIVAGIAIVALSIYLGPAGVGLISGMYVMQGVLFGAAIALGGIAQLLTSQPSQILGDQDKTTSSYIFTGAVNTVQQGECVPVAYGSPFTGSAVVSAGIETIDIEV